MTQADGRSFRLRAAWVLQTVGLLALLSSATSCRPESISRAENVQAQRAGLRQREEPRPRSLLLGSTHYRLYDLHGISPQSPTALADLARALMTSDLIGISSPAVLDQLRRVASEPNDPNELRALADLLAAENRYGLATLWLDAALAAAPERHDLAAQLGNALLEFGRPSLAILAYERAASLNPASADLWVRLARACLAEGRTRRARLALERVISLEPTDDEERWARTALVRLDMQEGVYAGPTWDTPGPDGSPLGIGPLRIRTNVAFERGMAAREPDERIEWLGEAVRCDPGMAEGWYNLAIALCQDRRWSEAAERFRAASALWGEENALASAHARAGEALCLAYLGRLREAEAEARECVALSPDSAWVRHVSARVALIGDNPELARSRCMEALARWPEHADSLGLLAECLMLEGQTEAARRSVEYAMWAEPSPAKRAELSALVSRLK